MSTAFPYWLKISERLSGCVVCFFLCGGDGACIFLCSYVWGMVSEYVHTQSLMRVCVHALWWMCVSVLCVSLGRTVWSTGILLWFCVGLFSTRDAGSVDWNPSGHQGHLIPPLPKHWTKCSCIIHVYITLLLCKVFTQSFCRTIYCTYPLDVNWQTFPIPLSLSLSLTVPFFHDDFMTRYCLQKWFPPGTSP